MTIYPAIDLQDGRCVRLQQGRADAATVYADDPPAVARGFAAAGARWIHVVDLDGAFRGEPVNLRVVSAIAETGLTVQFGGGLRTRESVELALELGASRVVLGTRAATDPEFVAGLARDFGPRIAVGLDARNGEVAIRGWVEGAGVRALDLAARLEDCGVATLIYTDIATDGMLTGPNLPALTQLLDRVQCVVIASGGVSRREDIIALRDLARAHPQLEGAIVGKALYERRVELSDLLQIAADAAD